MLLSAMAWIVYSNPVSILNYVQNRVAVIIFWKFKTEYAEAKLYHLTAVLKIFIENHILIR